jgi:hypothetical protein
VPARVSLDVMTFNLRYASASSPHSWAERRPVTRKLLRRESPQLICTQEGPYQQLRDIERRRRADRAPRPARVTRGR